MTGNIHFIFINVLCQQINTRSIPSFQAKRHDMKIYTVAICQCSKSLDNDSISEDIFPFPNKITPNLNCLYASVQLCVVCARVKCFPVHSFE